MSLLPKGLSSSLVAAAVLSQASKAGALPAVALAAMAWQVGARFWRVEQQAPRHQAGQATRLLY